MYTEEQGARRKREGSPLICHKSYRVDIFHGMTHLILSTCCTYPKMTDGRGERGYAASAYTAAPPVAPASYKQASSHIRRGILYSRFIQQQHNAFRTHLDFAKNRGRMKHSETRRFESKQQRAEDRARGRRVAAACWAGNPLHGRVWRLPTPLGSQWNASLRE